MTVSAGNVTPSRLEGVTFPAETVIHGKFTGPLMA